MASDATQLLIDLRAGHRAGTDELFPLVYQELRGLAACLVRHERPDVRPDSTSLVHEAYLRLINQAQADQQDRARFCAIAARAMRQILVDHARWRKREKRGGGRDQVPLDSALVLIEEEARSDVEGLDAALNRLARINPSAARIIELHFFAGLTLEESATALGVSPSTADREWRYARSWLYCELADETTTRRATGHETPGPRTTGG
jgi:RNA polymerase sigma-70 factor, ECF subfamily